MTEAKITEEVERLVDILIRAGCEIQAVGSGYCVDEPEDETMLAIVHAALQEFGPRDHLISEINACLRRLGRVVII